MSIVNTETLQANKLVAQNGDETKEVLIPSLAHRLAFALGDFAADTGTVVINKTVNVSSITRVSTGVFEVTLKNAASNTHFCVSGSVSGGVYLFSQFETRTTNKFKFNSVRSNTIAAVDPVIVDFSVFDMA